MKTLVRIQQYVPLTIFDEPTLAKKVEKLFKGAEEKMKVRIDEIVKFLESDATGEFSYEKIKFLFKGYFFKLILNEAVEITFARHENYDILSNILSLLSEEKLETAIMGEPMIDAFSNVILSISTNNTLSVCLNSSKISSLEKEFLGKSIFSTVEKRNNGQNNHSVTCGCFCTCDSNCNGNTKKCTSKKAIEKGCEHHCNCYIGSMMKNLPK